MKTTLTEKQRKRVKCIYCENYMHINKFGGIKQEGLFCNNILCLIKLIEDDKKYKEKK